LLRAKTCSGANRTISIVQLSKELRRRTKHQAKQQKESYNGNKQTELTHQRFSSPMIASNPSSQSATTKMYPGFTMPFTKGFDSPAVLADDFAVWSAAFSWNWKVSGTWTPKPKVSNE